jgi:hypothetical protein
VRIATFSPTGSWDEVALRTFGGPDEGIGLTQREFPHAIYAGPVLHNPTVQQFGNTGPSIPAYLIEGSYTVTATAIASPIRVRSSAGRRARAAPRWR